MIYRKTRLLIIKISIILFLTCTLSYSAQSQSFNNTTGGTIPVNTLSCFPVVVSGLPAIADSINFGLISVCLNIQHNWIGQLDISLQSPNGTQIILANNRGGNGRNFTGTCFREDGLLHIQAGVAPFIGNHIPEQTINLFNDGQNPNGSWQLCVLDELPGTTGRVISYTLTFGPNPPPTPELSICSVTDGKACKCADGLQKCELLPDMTNSERVLQLNNVEFTGRISIGVGTPNIGFGPLEMRATNECFCDSLPVSCSTTVCPDGKLPKQKVAQRIYYKDSARMSFIDRSAGFMQYHAAHGHVHIDNWTLNTLRLPGPNPNPATWPIIGTSAKVSFCLVNNFNCSANPGYCKDKNGQPLTYNDVGNPGLGIATGCGLNQGIFPGYLDIYSIGLPGQDIEVSNNLCNGYYYICSITDPDNLVKESDETNNVALVPVFLTLQAGDCCNTEFTADNTTGVAPLTVQFTDQTAPLSEKWQWDFGDGNTATTQFPSHTYTTPGVYTVTLRTVAKGTSCSDTLKKTKYITVFKTGTTSNPNSIRVFPNPFQGQFNMFINLNSPSKVSYEIFDYSGRLIKSSSPELLVAGNHIKNIIPGLTATGMYILAVNINGQKYYFKIAGQ